jgi:hypothetical protein
MSYEERALKLAYKLVKLFEDCWYIDDFKQAAKWYNKTHKRGLHYSYGVSRFVVLCADYVIKFDIIPEGCFSDGHAGNCSWEKTMYDMAVEEGYEYLLAKPSIYIVDGRLISIMPRISNVNNCRRTWWKYCTEDEQRWIFTHFEDLHPGNVGYRKGKVCLIDYAFQS